MKETLKQIDYIEVYHERKSIDGILYPRYFINNDIPIGIPNGISFYRKARNVKYVRLSSTDTVKGMMLRYYSKHTQIQALLKLISIKNMQQDSRPTVELRAEEKRYRRTGINESMPPGVCVTSRMIDGRTYRRVTVNVFCVVKNKFVQRQLHAGKGDDEQRLEETIKRALELRKSSLALAASLTQVNASKGV